MSKKNTATSKSAHKAARKNIESGIIAHLKEITAKIGPVSKKLAKVIDKGSQKLAKKIAKEIALIKPATEKAVPAPVAKPSVVAKKPEVKSTPVAKPAAAAKKTEVKSTPVAKPAASKTKAVK